MSAMESFLKIDEKLYSRQLYVLGTEAMRKMATASVLISGMKGLGVEIAKNIILAGVKSVTVHDQEDAQWRDLSSQFYLSEKDVGHNRAMVSRHHLAELNKYVPVHPYTGELSESFLSSFQVVVLTNSSLKEQQRINDFCHTRNICFVLADTKGLTGQLFCDFGEDFTVYDPSDAEPVSAIIQDITQGNPGILRVACEEEEGEGHNFEDGDWVTFSEVEGMTELNSLEPRLIRVIGQYTLEVGDTSSFSPYQSGGMITQVKMPQKHSFGTLQSSMTHPKIKTQDAEKLSRYYTLHVAFWALHVFQNEMQRLPRPWNQADADKMVKLAQTLPVNQEQLDHDLIRIFAYSCAGDLSPINAFVGAVAAQEVLKAASGKFTPLDQWLYFDAYECLPEEGCAVHLTEADCAPHGSRYDGQIAIFGANFQEQLGKQKYFVVGAGAIGCELLKNFAMIGLAAGEGGNITVTDMDTIEYSNLNRQFLFQFGDISKQKSEVAAAAIKHMNPNINVTAQQNQVGSDTESFYGADFFHGLDGVATALDSMEAREYVGQRCVQFLKPLLDSGTAGTKGHAQVFVPFLTESYGHSPDLEKREHPLCTLRYFPSTIHHTLQWARDRFEYLFKTTAENFNAFLIDPNFLETQEIEALEMLQITLQEKPHSVEDCVIWARRLWERIFSHDMKQLLHQFPPGHETNSGLPFWAGSKRCPQPLSFDFSNNAHRIFISAASYLFAQTHQLDVGDGIATACHVLLDLHLPPFQPSPEVHIPLTEEELQASKGTIDQTRLAELRQALTKSRQKLEEQGAITSQSMKLVQFEKDDDSHIEFIMTAANLRAENYGIPPVDKLQAKKIVGRIVPAISTTTAAVAGLVCLELYKLVWGHKCLCSYRSSFLQLSEPLLNRFQPLPDKDHQMTWSCWDRIEVPGVDAKGKEITLRDLCDYLKREHNLVLRMLLYGQAVLYDGFWKEQKIEQRLASRLTDLVCSIHGQTMPKDCLLVLTIVCEGEEDYFPPVHICL